MKTPKIFAIAAAVSFALCAQLHNKMTTGDWLAIDDYPAYVGELATYGYENFGIKDNLVPAVKREWRDLRITVTNNINHYAAIAQSARSEVVQVTDSAPETSLRPKLRPENLARKFAIQQALQEIQNEGKR